MTGTLGLNHIPVLGEAKLGRPAAAGNGNLDRIIE
jgi:hypothetical protein